MTSENNYNITWKDISLKKGKEIFLLSSTGITEEIYLKSLAEIIWEKDFSSCPNDEVLKIKEAVLNLLTNKPQTYQGEDVPFKFIIDNKEYGLQYDLSSTVWGQFVDQELLFEKQNNIWENVEQILACIIRPIKDKDIEKKEFKPSFWKSKKQKRVEKLEKELLQNELMIEDYDSFSRMKRAKLFLEKMNMEQAYGVFFYLTIIVVNFLSLTTISSMQESNNPNLTQLVKD